MAAACFPEEQRKVQEELDMVIGINRGRLIVRVIWALISKLAHSSTRIH